LIPYLLILPGLAWILFFFLVPLLSLVATSLQKRAGTSLSEGFVPALQFSNYTSALGEYFPQFIRAFVYAGIATALALVIAYPIAYYIAFKATKYKYLMLVLVIAPFFASFLLRTNAWKTILSADGFVVETLNALSLLPEDRILNTSVAVIFGLTYNFLPFMILPLYASLDRIDPRLVEAASDLYASPATGFWRVVWPLSMPGVLGGVVLTFIPASGDYINAQLLGSTNDKMIGNVIQAQFIVLRDYPIASALSAMFMFVLLIIIVAYIRRVGTRQLV